ncbi:secreted frizzled-related protein 2-like [Salarias fasciatus]|nr:secreted frizzled-related protein 2-like [Salarias fasciatus]
MSVLLLGSLLCGALTAAAAAGPDGVPHLSPRGPPAVGFRSSVRSVCRPIPSTLSLCHGIGYRRMWVPNLLGHDSLREAQQQSAAWLPLISKRCHRDTGKFLCSLFSPVCLSELRGPVSPCRSLCEAVRDGCLPVMSAFGFPWPEMFSCSRFPGGTELCIPPTGEQEGPEADPAGSPGHGEELKGSVVCEACSLAAEGEAEIQESFCHSSYAFKMRLASVSTVGGDRQLVPTARSRILRWAGGGAERAEEVGGAMAHSALWLQEGATCTCPSLDSTETHQENLLAGEAIDKRPAKEDGKVGAGAQSGWFLALAQAEEGRLVVTRLTKWTRGDKELKKFIRALLKLSCPEV